MEFDDLGFTEDVLSQTTEDTITTMKLCDFTEILRWDSGSDGLGITYYVLYQNKDPAGPLLVFSHGACAGYEFERWELIELNGANATTYQKWCRATTDQERCASLHAMDKRRIYDVDT